MNNKKLVLLRLHIKGKAKAKRTIESCRVQEWIAKWKKIYALHNHDYEIFVQIPSKMK